MKPTKKHFEIFKEEAQKWVYFFGLNDWRITYGFEYIEDSYADNSKNAENKWAHIRLSTDNIDEKHLKIEEIVRKSAFHEVCHLLHGGFEFCFQLTKEGVYPDRVFDKECETFVRILENSIYKTLK